MPKPYRVGVIGRSRHGGYGHQVDRAWRTVPNTQVVAVSDDDQAGLAAATRRLEVGHAFADYREMIDKVELDIVAICPRWIDQHRDMAVAAARKGLHIYMEKPFCRTPAEADEVVAACEGTGVKLAVAHPTRYSPKLATVKQLISDGAIGRVLEFRARGKEDRRGGGEDLWVLGTHMMDLIRAIGGQPQWCFARVTQDGVPITKADVVEGNEGIGPLAGDAVYAMYRMPDGSTAYFNSERNVGGRPWRYGLQVFGSAGVIEILEDAMPSVKYLGDPSWSPGRSGSKWQDVSSAGIGEPEPLQGDKYSARHTMAILDLLDAIENDRQPQCGVYEARGGTEMIAAVFESQRLGGPVSFPLKNRQNPLTMV